MAYFLTPRYAPAQLGHCNRLAYAPVQPVQRYVIRPQIHPWASFAGFFDSALNEIEHEVRRELHRQRRQHKQVIRAHFVVNENETGYQIDGELPMFEQENFTLEVTDAHTIKVTGNTKQKAEQPTQANKQVTESSESQHETMDVNDNTVPIIEADAPTARPRSPAASETASNRSYHATVEDDFEDLGAEMAAAPSTTSKTSAEPKESKDKEKAVEPQTEQTVTQPQPEVTKSSEGQQQSEPEQEERTTYTFERTFRFTDRIEGGDVTATFKNGLLSVVVPKSKAPGLRRIQIQ